MPIRSHDPLRTEHYFDTSTVTEDILSESHAEKSVTPSHEWNPAGWRFKFQPEIVCNLTYLHHYLNIRNCSII